MNINFYKKIIVSILVISILLPNILFLPTKKAEAYGVITYSPIEWLVAAYDYYLQNEGWIKDYILDPAAWYLKNAILANITNSTINWINSGFEGSPTFVSNPEAFLGDIGDQATGAIFHKLQLDGVLCSPFKQSVLFALQYSKPSINRYKCTITGAIDNFEAFSEDFNQGGWKGWLEMTSKAQNNPFGAYMEATTDMDKARNNAQTTAKLETTWGGGFMSLKECSVSINTDALVQADCGNVCAQEGANLSQCMDVCTYNADPSSISKEEACKLSGGQMQNTTPGKVIGDQLTKSMNFSSDSLVAADEISEALGAIANALINQLISTGLRSMTSTDSSGNVQGGNWYNSLDITQDRNNLLTQVDASINIENEYKGVRDQSVNKLSDIISVREETVICYEKNDTAGNDSKITSLLNQIDQSEKTINTIETDIGITQQFINNLNEIKSDAISASSMNGLNQPIKNFTEIAPDLHNTLNTSNAQLEFDEFTTDYNKALSERNQCQDPINLSPLNASAKELNFGIIDRLGSLIKEVVITNKDTVSSFKITGVSAPSLPFNITENTCANKDIAPNATCIIKIKFSPLAVKTYYDSILIFSNEGDRHVFLRGVGR